ncbi:MAG: type II toxin-antitoxin system VapC family toxin [Chromatiaceae bacterium]|jgi:PIN domain nuclease of toxin-antitoxin system
MRLLLDTHSLLWALGEPALLSQKAREALNARENIVYVSVVSLWECAIKASLGKLRLPGDFFEALAPAGFEWLPIALPHLNAYVELPMHHRDPFDRMLVAQALHEQLALVTRDQAIRRYAVPVISA